MLVVAYVAYGAAMLSLIVLRWKKPDTAEWKRPFKVERTMSSSHSSKILGKDNAVNYFCLKY